MATQILALPLLSFGLIVGNNEDWVDSWAYVDADQNPILLAGLTINFMVKRSAADHSAVLIASTAPTVDGLVARGLVLVTGSSGNVLGLAVPPPVMSRIAPGTYAFEAQALGDGLRRTIATGSVQIQEGIIP